MMSKRLLVGTIACGAKLLSLSAGTAVIERAVLATDSVSSTRQHHGRGLWDLVPEPDPTRYATQSVS